MSPRTGPAVLACVVAWAGWSGTAWAASVSRVEIELGQGKSRFAGKSKYRARGTISFLTSDDGVACEDSITLERRIKESVNNRFRYRWVEIAEGDQRERTCADRPTAPKPVRQRSAVSLFHDPKPYLRILERSKLRMRYRVRISFAGQTVFRRSVTRPVTAETLVQRFRTVRV